MSDLNDIPLSDCAKVQSLETTAITDHPIVITQMATTQLCSQTADAKEISETTDVSLKAKQIIKIANRHVTCPPAIPDADSASLNISRSLETAVPLPLNFGCVIPGVFRSSYPQAQDLAYLSKLKLKTIVTLVQKDLPEGFQEFIDSNGITHKVFDMTGTKKAEIPPGPDAIDHGDHRRPEIPPAPYPLQPRQAPHWLRRRRVSEMERLGYRLSCGRVPQIRGPQGTRLRRQVLERVQTREFEARYDDRETALWDHPVQLPHHGRSYQPRGLASDPVFFLT
ncbi:hypothetical protein PG987_012240 [Apiospora arundinis]